MNEKIELKKNSRIIAMMELYNYDFKKELDFESVLTFIKENNILEKDDSMEVDSLKYDEDYLHTLVDGTISHLEYLDYVISLNTDNYTLDTLSFVDRSIIRLGAFELIYLHEPVQIVINEMCNISRVYSTIEGFPSNHFNNAILDKIAHGNYKDE